MTMPSPASARTLTRARFYLFGTDVHTCAGCYGPPHVIETRAFLYTYLINPSPLHQGGAPANEGLPSRTGEGGATKSPPVCSQACIEMALRRAAYKAKPLPPLAEKLRAGARRDFAEERRQAREAAAAAQMARLRALGEDAVAQHMAEIIVARTAGQEACERQHLVAAGFTVDELTRLGPAAVARAAAQHPSLRG